jgi:poly(A) polymerase
VILSKPRLDAVLMGRDVEDGLERLRSTGTLTVMFPEVEALVGFGGGDTGHKDLWGHTKRVVAQCIRKPIVRWAALFHDVGKVRCFQRAADGTVSFHHHEAVSAKLFRQAVQRTTLFTKLEADWIHFIIYNLGYVEGYESDWTDSAVRRVYRHTGMHFEDIMAVARADITTKHMTKRLKHLRRMHEFRVRAEELARQDAIPPALPKGLGEVLSKTFDIPPSRELGNLMKVLRDAVENGELERQPSVGDVIAHVKNQKLVNLDRPSLEEQAEREWEASTRCKSRP